MSTAFAECQPHGCTGKVSSRSDPAVRSQSIGRPCAFGTINRNNICINSVWIKVVAVRHLLFVIKQIRWNIMLCQVNAQDADQRHRAPQHVYLSRFWNIMWNAMHWIKREHHVALSTIYEYIHRWQGILGFVLPLIASGWFLFSYRQASRRA